MTYDQSRLPASGTRSGALGRRAFLGLSAAALAGFGLAGCGGASTGPGATGGGAAGALPRDIPPTALPGARVSAVPGVPVLQTAYPTSPAASTSGAPAKGGVIRTMQINFYPPPPPKSQNPWFQEYEKRIGASVEPTLVTDSDIAQKTQTMLAGGELPDITHLHLDKVPAAMTAVSQGAFLDLFPYLGGDKVDEFPNLGGIQQESWHNSVIDGKLIGVPYPTPLIGSGLPQYRRDWQRKLDVADPTDADAMFDFFGKLVKGDPDGDGKADTWIWGAMTEWDNQTVLHMFGVPNNWVRNDDGTFTKHLETPQYLAALKYLVRCREAGYFHPNAASNGYAQGSQLFADGQLAVFGGGLMGVASPQPIKGVSNWNEDIWSIFPPGHDGGPAPLWKTSGTFGFFALPAALAKDEARVRELLSVINYWAAPWGSDEYTFMRYGIEGRNYTRTGDGPVRSEDSARMGEMAASYVPNPAEQNIFIPGGNEVGAKIQAGYEQVMPDAVADASLNLASATKVSSGATLGQMEKDMYVDVVSGRASLDEFPAMIDAWRKAGGDAVRSELEQSAKAGG